MRRRRFASSPALTRHSSRLGGRGRARPSLALGHKPLWRPRAGYVPSRAFGRAVTPARRPGRA
eukprot:7658419-Lingulodinium_polyedra.AAC.1